MNASLRRGACPGLSQPMATGDGLLARITPTGATIPCKAFAELCAAARSCGSGVIEVTSRGSIQIRGLTESSTKQFAATVGAIEVALCEGPPVLIPPLTGLDPDEAIDVSAIAAQLRRVLVAAAFLTDIGPKVSIALDGGGLPHLDAVAADVRMRAKAGSACLHIAVAGDAQSATHIGAVAAEHAVQAATRMVRVIAAAGPVTRARDIVAASGAAAFRQAIADILIEVPALPQRPKTETICTHALRDSSVAVGFGLAFGHADSAALEELTHAASVSGAVGLRTAPAHVLLIVGVCPRGAQRLADIARRLGFIVSAEDPRRQVIACAGAPICSAAEIRTRALAPALAGDVAISGTIAPIVHVSGCVKGCACPRSAPLTVVGIEGRCGVVVNGSAHDRPLVVLPPEALPSALARVEETVRHMRTADENAAEVLSRLGHEQIARLMLGEAADA